MYDLTKIKPIPQSFYEWVENELTPEPIFYKNHRECADLICGHCGESTTVFFDGYEADFELPAEKPKRGKYAVCPLCGHESYYEIGTVTATHREYRHFVLLQQDTDGNLIARAFETHHSFQKGYEPTVKTTELERYVYRPGSMIKLKWDCIYCDDGHWRQDWKEKKAGRMTFAFSDTEAYEGNFRDGYSIQKEIKTSTLPFFNVDVYSPAFDFMWGDGPKNYAYRLMKGLALFTRAPYSESFCKIGWEYIVYCLIDHEGADQSINRKGKSLKSQLRLKNPTSIKIFRSMMITEKEYWKEHLTTLQMIEKKKIKVTEDEYIQYSTERSISGVELGNMLGHMTFKQLLNRVQEYSKKEKISKREALTEYRDYLKLREALGYDMTNEVFVHPKELLKKHRELVIENERRKDSEKKKAVNCKFKAMEKNFKQLMKIYGWESQGFVIRPAMKASELIIESSILHHCVGASDTYMERHSKGQSYILFLRKEAEPDVPFTTIEITGQGKEPKILQWYEAYDRKPDADVLQPIINEYVEHLKGIIIPGKRAAS